MKNIHCKGNSRVIKKIFLVFKEIAYVKAIILTRQNIASNMLRGI